MGDFTNEQMKLVELIAETAATKAIQEYDRDKRENVWRTAILSALGGGGTATLLAKLFGN